MLNTLRQWLLLNGPSVDQNSPIPISGDKVVEGLKAWVVEEFRQPATRFYDVGKTLLSLSTTSITVLMSAGTLLRHLPTTIGWSFFGVGLCAFVTSALASLQLVVPQVVSLNEKNIWETYCATIRVGQRNIRWWGFFWLIGTGAALCAFVVWRNGV
jgi:hypothetical protein